MHRENFRVVLHSVTVTDYPEVSVSLYLISDVKKDKPLPLGKSPVVRLQKVKGIYPMSCSAVKLKNSSTGKMFALKAQGV